MIEPGGQRRDADNGAHTFTTVSITAGVLPAGRSIDAKDSLGRREIRLVRDGVGSDVLVIMPAIAVDGETMGMLHAQIESLTQQEGEGLLQH